MRKPKKVFEDVKTLVEKYGARHIFFWDPETLERRRRLPDHVSHHLIFGFKRNALLPGDCGDQVVTVASQLRLEAQDEAATVFGLDADHTEILRRPEIFELLNTILENAADQP